MLAQSSRLEECKEPLLISDVKLMLAQLMNLSSQHCYIPVEGKECMAVLNCPLCATQTLVTLLVKLLPSISSSQHGAKHAPCWHMVKACTARRDDGHLETYTTDALALLIVSV